VNAREGHIPNYPDWHSELRNGNDSRKTGNSFCLRGKIKQLLDTTAKTPENVLSSLMMGQKLISAGSTAFSIAALSFTIEIALE
jgi:hypothetical protein